MPKLTQKSVQSARYKETSSGYSNVFCSNVHGFGLRTYKSGKKSFFVQYRVKGERNSKTIILGDVEIIDLVQARNKAKKYLQQALEGVDPKRSTKQNGGIKFKEFVEKHYMPNKIQKTRTAKEDVRRLELHAFPRLKDRDIEDITKRDLLRLQTDLSEKLRIKYKETKEEKNLSPATVNRVMAVIKHVFSFAQKHDFIKTNPASSLELYKTNESKDVFLDNTDIKILVDSIECEPDIYMRHLFMVLLYSGRRVGEFLNLKWTNVDMAERCLVFEKTKAGVKQSIHINNALYIALEKLPKVKDNEYVFVGRKEGEPIKAYKNAWKRILGRIGVKNGNLKKLRVHDLRHNAATFLAIKGVSSAQIAQQLGHLSSKTTQRYMHLSAKRNASTSNILEEIGKPTTRS